eukprot:scaffold3795_cov126-Isochrysis_galbana.AAC.20
MDGSVGKSGRLGNLRVTKPTPNFLRNFQTEQSGIDGALQRYKDREACAAESREQEEEPQIVDEADAMPSKERARAVASKGGSLRFKGEDTSAAAKFVDSAYLRVAQQRDDAAPDEAASESTGSHVFASARRRMEAKRKAPQNKLPAAKAVKNPGLLSFSADD